MVGRKYFEGGSGTMKPHHGDFALACKLAFYTGGGYDQMRQLRASVQVGVLHWGRVRSDAPDIPEVFAGKRENPGDRRKLRLPGSSPAPCNRHAEKDRGMSHKSFVQRPLRCDPSHLPITPLQGR